MKGSLDQGGFNHSVGRECTLNWPNRSSHLSRHQLKEIRRHGEAGSVNIETVEEEQARIREPLARFRPEDRWNVNESALTLDGLLDPEEEREIGKSLYSFEGGDAEIVGMVQQEIGLRRGDIEEIDSDDEPEVVPPPLKEVIKMCRILEEYSMVVCTKGAFKFLKALREYRGHLQEMSREREKQTTLDTA